MTTARPTRVVHCRRDSYDVYIGRPSRWGNPYRIGPDGTRAEVIARYRKWLLSQPELLAAIGELAGRRLGCWCAPQPCHGDVLADLADEKAGESGAAVAQTLTSSPSPCPNRARSTWP
jgi:hypothetical protein